MMEYPHHSLYLAPATFSIPYKVLHRIPRMRSSLLFQRGYLGSLVTLPLEALAKEVFLAGGVGVTRGISGKIGSGIFC